MKTSEFNLSVGGRSVTCLLAEPEKLAADPAMLLTFSLTRQMSILEDVYNIPTKAFVDAGHRALSFDLPCHGDRATPGQTSPLHGFCDRVVAGSDPFGEFIADGRAAVDASLARGLAKPGRIVLAGLSRAGYCAVRLAAAEPRITATAAIAPVTDWRVLGEFADAKDRADVAVLSLEHYANQLAGKALFVAIGSADRRVGTERCAAFMTGVYEAEAAIGLKHSRLELHMLANTENHAIGNEWRAAGANYLLSALS